MSSFIQQRLGSFRYAFQGVGALLRTQPNMRLHAVAALLVIVAAIWLQVTTTEWAALVLAIGLVWTAEALNTAVEFLGDAITRERNAWVGKAKDVAAAAVLFSAITAFVVGLLVFGRHLWRV